MRNDSVETGCAVAALVLWLVWTLLVLAVVTGAVVLIWKAVL